MKICPYFVHFLSDICLTMHYWCKWYGQPTRCNNYCGILLVVHIIFRPICIKFNTGDVYKRLSIEFYEIQCRESYTLLRGVNEFPYFSTFIAW